MQKFRRPDEKHEPHLMLRAFIAFGLGADARAAIADYVMALRNLRERVSWVKAENVHLTLKFLGDTPQEKIDNIADVLRDVARTASPISVTIGGGGVFPNEQRPRVLWIGMEEASGALQELATAIDERLHRLGFAKENRPFHPHLTIGRVRDGSVAKIVAAMRDQPFDHRAVQLNEIALMRSELHPGGSVYTPLCEIMLGNP